MRRTSHALVGLALLGWCCAGAAQVLAFRADDEERASRWTVARNRFLLLSSVSMNTLVLRAVYRFATRRGDVEE